ncbi:MAG: ATP-binding cassette domain-containing protein, partial [Bacteroidota bacterium]
MAIPGRSRSAHCCRRQLFVIASACHTHADKRKNHPFQTVNIKVEHVSVSRSGHQVLNDLSFELQDGHILSVMGKSGCGKTTLLRVIAGLG